MSRRRLKRRYGGARKYSAIPDATGRKRILKAWVVYRGYTLDPWKGKKVAHSKATYEVRVFKGAGIHHGMEGNAYGETLDEAMNKARRLVDAMHGD